MPIRLKFSYPLSPEKWDNIVKARRDHIAGMKEQEGFESWPAGVKKHVLSGRAWEMQLRTINYMRHQYTLHPVDRLVDVLNYWIECGQRDAAMTDEERGWNPDTEGNRGDYCMLAWLEPALDMVRKGECEAAIEKLIDMNTNHPTSPPLDAFDFTSDDWLDMEIVQISEEENERRQEEAKLLYSAIFGANEVSDG